MKFSDHTSKVTETSAPRAHAVRSARGDDEDEKMSWALALTQTVKNEVMERHLLAGDSPRGSAGNSAGALTQSHESFDAGSAHARAVGKAAPIEGASRVSNRIEGELDGGELGRVRFEIIRDEAGLRVVLGVENAAQRALVEAEGEMLRAVLNGNGLKLASFVVTGLDGAGTGLALQRRATQTPRSESASAAYRTLRQQRRSESGDLDLIG